MPRLRLRLTTGWLRLTTGWLRLTTGWLRLSILENLLLLLAPDTNR